MKDYKSLVRLWIQEDTIYLKDECKIRDEAIKTYFRLVYKDISMADSWMRFIDALNNEIRMIRNDIKDNENKLCTETNTPSCKFSW